MLLDQKVAVIFGAGGAIGRAVADEFAREGATLFLSGRTLSSVEQTAAALPKTTGSAQVAQVDALDEQAIHQYLERVGQQAGGVDIVFNAVGLQPAHIGMGTPAIALEYEQFLLAFTAHAGSQFLTSRAAARVMLPRRSGVIFFLGSPTGRVPFPGTAGIAASNTAMEGLARTFAVELGPVGIQVIYAKVGPFPETRGPQQAVQLISNAMGMAPEMLGQAVIQASLLKRTPTLKEAAEAMAFLASHNASAMTGVIANITAGQYVD
jgi:NAD(P)-dependent dehydrogenase (short-subunit alcohol dehydrogenase family)